MSLLSCGGVSSMCSSSSTGWPGSGVVAMKVWAASSPRIRAGRSVDRSDPASFHSPVCFWRYRPPGGRPARTHADSPLTSFPLLADRLDPARDLRDFDLQPIPSYGQESTSVWSDVGWRMAALCALLQ